MAEKSSILLIIPRYNMTNQINHNYAFPFGLGYISAILKKQGYPVDCLNLNHKKGKIEDVLKKALDEKKYDFVCTGNLAVGYNITEKIISSARKHNSKPQIILGGLIITSEPELIFNTLNPDFGVIGEGEETIIELLEAVKKKENLENVKGIIYTKDGQLTITQKRDGPKDLDSLPFPDFDGLKFEEQVNHQHCNDNFVCNQFDFPRLYPILGSRGCPFQCTFCYHYDRYRARSVKNILEELNTNVKKYNINIVQLYDECFAVDKERVREFCEGINKLSNVISRKLSWICQIRVDSFDKEVLKLMRESGCSLISYGFESFSPTVLKSMEKNITPEQIEKAFKDTLEAGISIQANFIFGDIAETKETAKETIDWWKKNSKGNINLCYVRPYPGSVIYKHCIKKGIIKDKLEFIKNIDSNSLVMNMTDNMTDKEDKKLKQRTLVDLRREYGSWVVPISIKKDINNTFSITVKCPYCKKIITYRNCLFNNAIIYLDRLTCRECPMRFFVISPTLKFYKKYFEKYFFLTGRWGVLKQKIKKLMVLHKS